jgi:hypothetical protein
MIDLSPRPCRRQQARPRHLLLAAVLASAACLAQAGPAAGGEDSPGFSAGVEARPEASANEIGLPLYPGAVQRRDGDDDSSGATLGLWGGSWGFRLSVLKFSTSDTPGAVAAFYREALGRYGTVLDCSRKPATSAASGSNRSRSARRSASIDADGTHLNLSCDDDEGGGLLFKAGRPNDFRLVSVKSVDGATQFELLRLRTGASEGH